MGRTSVASGCFLALLLSVSLANAQWSYKTTQDGQYRLGRNGSDLSVEFRAIIVTFHVPENWQILACTEEPMDWIYSTGSPTGLSLDFRVGPSTGLGENPGRLSLPEQYRRYLKAIHAVYDDKVKMSPETPFHLPDGRRLTPRRYFSDYWGQRLVLLVPEGEDTCEFEFAAKGSLSGLRASHDAIQHILDSYRCTHKKPSNQSMKPTPKAFASRLAPLRYNFSVFATAPCRGLSLSR